MPEGYSGTPLAKKLGLTPGMRAWFHNLPNSVRAEIGDIGFDEQVAASAGLHYAHIFRLPRREKIVVERGA